MIYKVNLILCIIRLFKKVLHQATQISETMWNHVWDWCSKLYHWWIQNSFDSTISHETFSWWLKSNCEDKSDVHMNKIQKVFKKVSEKLSDKETKSFWWIFKTAITKRTNNFEILKKTKESAL